MRTRRVGDRARPPTRTSAWRHGVGVKPDAAGSVSDDGWVAGSVGVRPQSAEKLIGGVEDRAEPAGRSIDFDLLLACLPLRRPVPSLIGITLSARSEQNAIADDFSLKLVAVVQAHGKPKLLRQCHPPIDGEPRRHHVITVPAPTDCPLHAKHGSRGRFCHADMSATIPSVIFEIVSRLSEV